MKSYSDNIPSTSSKELEERHNELKIMLTTSKKLCKMNLIVSSITLLILLSNIGYAIHQMLNL